MWRANPIAVMVLLLVAADCGGSGRLTAIDLRSGKTRTFGSADEVPSGWALCDGPNCTAALGAVPCQNLGLEACRLSSQCEVVDGPCGVTGSSGSGGATPGGSGGSDGDPDRPPGTDSLPPDAGCEQACVPLGLVLCGQFIDAPSCASMPSCQWQELCPSCPAGVTCPPCVEACVDRQPPRCEELDEPRCLVRADCSWLPQPCPPCLAGEPCASCPSFCSPTGTACAPVAPPAADLCPGGRPSPQFDAAGCVTGYSCADPCSNIPLPAPDQCPDGQQVPEYDAQGCVVGYDCQPVIDRCDQLASAYDRAIDSAKACALSNPGQPEPPAGSACTLLYDNRLACGCPTTVNPDNTQAIAELDRLRSDWQAADCARKIVCPSITCALPQSASCLPNATGTGRCADGR